MRVTVRQWAGLCCFWAIVMVTSGLGGAMPLPQASGAFAHPIVAGSRPVRRSSTVLPEFPNNLTHFVLILRENHVFDDYLGDCATTINDTCNGGKDYTTQTNHQVDVPDLHALARNYSVFDNFYSSIDPWSAQGHNYLFTANVWGGTDSGTGCSNWAVEGTGPNTQWGNTNNSAVIAGNCAWSPDLGSQTYNATGGAIFDRFFGPNVPQTKTTIPFMADGDNIWELSSAGCSVPSSQTIPGDSQQVVQIVTGCTNGYWYNSSSGTPSMPPTINPYTGIPQFLWECQFSSPCSSSTPSPFLDSYAANAFDAYLKDYGLPTYTEVELQDDHPGSYCGQTDPICIQWNDAATMNVVSAILNTTYRSNTMIAITEDDTQQGQNGPDHVNNDRRLPLVIIAPPSVAKTGGAPSTCGISSSYTSCGYVVHQMLNFSNLLSAMERVELNVYPNLLYQGGIAPNNTMFPMVQNDYLAEGSPLEPLWKCSGTSAAYCNTGPTSGTPALSGTTVSPSSVTTGTGTTTTLAASATCTGGTCPGGVAYAWSLSPASLGSLSSPTGSSVTFTSGNSAGTGTLYENASLSGVIKGTTVPVTVTSSSTPTLSGTSVSPTSVSTGTNTPTSLTASATCTGGACPTGVTYTWALTPSSMGTLSSATGTTVTFTSGSTAATGTIYENASLNNVTQGTTVPVTVSTSGTPTLSATSVSPASVSTGTTTPTSLTASATCAGGTCPSGISYAWSLVPSSLGSLSAYTGTTITFTSGSSPGTGTLYENASLNGILKGTTVPVTVSSAAVTLTAVAVSPSGAVSVSPGGTRTFTATPTCSASCPSGVTYAWTLSSSLGNLSSPTSNPTTFTAGSSVGSLTVCVTAVLGSSSQQACTTVSISTATAVLSSVAVTPSGSVTLGEGATADFSAQAYDQYGNALSGASYQWIFLPASTGSLSGTTGSSTVLTAGTTPGANGSLVAEATLSGTTVQATVLVTIFGVTAAASPPTGSAPLAVSFSANAAGGAGGYTYTWIFGDGTSGTGAQTSHTYSNPGTYPVEVLVKDSTGNTAVGHLNVTVTSGSGTSNPSSGGGTADYLLYGLVGVAAILGIALVALFARSRKPRAPLPYPPPNGGY